MDSKHETRFEFSGALIAVAVIAIVFVGSLALHAGFWGALLASTVAAVVLIGVLVVWSMRRSHPSADNAPHPAHVSDGRHRVLVIADESCATSKLADAIRAHAADRSASVFVIAPALETRRGFLADDQKGFEQASDRLTATIHSLEQAGLPAQGEIGPADPLQAAEDGLRQFSADEIVFVTNPESGVNWLEKGVVKSAESRFDQPVSHMTVSNGRG